MLSSNSDNDDFIKLEVYRVRCVSFCKTRHTFVTMLVLQISDGWKLSEEYIVYFALLIGECIQQLSARRYHKIIMCTELMHVYMYVFM